MAAGLSPLEPLTNTLTSAKAKLLQREGKCKRPGCLPDERTWQKRHRLAPFEPCYRFDGTMYWPPWPTNTTFHDQASSDLAGRLPAEVLVSIWNFAIGPSTQAFHVYEKWSGEEHAFRTQRCELDDANKGHKCCDLAVKQWNLHLGTPECVPGDMDRGPLSLIRSCRKLYVLLAPPGNV